MTYIDIRLKSDEMAILNSMVGKKLISVKHDPFVFVNSSSQVVQINTEIGEFYLYSFVEPSDYFGAEEDVAVWTLETERNKVVDCKDFVETPINETVKSVLVVQENQRLFQNGTQIYDVWLTRGIIFDFGDHQFSLEKAVWFSEDIYIRKGYDLVNKFTSIDDFINSDWDEGCTAECSRQIITIG